MKKKAAVRLLSYGLTGALALGICAVPVSGASVVHAEEADETIAEADGEAKQDEEQAKENNAAQDQNEGGATGEKTNADTQDDSDTEEKEEVEKEEVEKDGEKAENTDKENTDKENAEDKSNEAEADVREIN